MGSALPGGKIEFSVFPGHLLHERVGGLRQLGGRISDCIGLVSPHRVLELHERAVCLHRVGGVLLREEVPGDG